MSLLDHFRISPAFLAVWQRLGSEEQGVLSDEIAHLATVVPHLHAVRQTCSDAEAIAPWTQWVEVGTPSFQTVGERLVRSNKVAAVLLAAGMGSRFGFSGPKGCFEVIGGKSLFELFAQQLKRASVDAGHPLECAILTSALNHDLTRHYFEGHHYFGLAPSQLHFVQQRSLPLLDQSGSLLWESPGKIAYGPSGNGDMVYSLHHSGLMSRWQDLGVEAITVVPVDNALGDLFDRELIGYHIHADHEVTIKGIRREEPTEKVGVLVLREGKLSIVEYTELPESYHSDSVIANSGLYALSLAFCKRVAQQTLPLHAIQKRINAHDGYESREQTAWKYESYLFDAFAYADRCGAMLYPRARCFAPLKSPEDITKVRSLLYRGDVVLSAINTSFCYTQTE